MAVFIGGKAQVGPTHLRGSIKRKREAEWKIISVILVLGSIISIPVVFFRIKSLVFN